MRFHYQKNGTLGWITMAGSSTNALSQPVFANREELRCFLEDRDLKGVVLRGQGRHFCSGADPGSFAELFRDCHALQNSLNQAKELLQEISFAPIPIAAMIFGSCLGAGLEIALACHFRYAATSAMFGFPECNHNLMPGLGGTIISQELISNRHLIDLVLSGRMIGAKEAEQIGLVDQVSTVKSIEAETVQFLETLTSNHSSKLIRTVMRSIHNGRRMVAEAALAEETRLFGELAKDLVAAETKQKNYS
jgi:enoyl-CoA hydratase